MAVGPCSMPIRITSSGFLVQDACINKSRMKMTVILKLIFFIEENDVQIFNSYYFVIFN